GGGAVVRLVVAVHDRGRHVADQTEPHRRAHPRHAEVGMSERSERWTFGLEPLPQALAVAPLLRRVAGLVLSLDGDDPAVAKLIDDLRDVERGLTERTPANPAPRLRDDASHDRRPDIDHPRDLGAYNACLPQYEITVAGAPAM